MKSVLLSIRPNWCEKIFNGEKTMEVRKTAPKGSPFKVYIYMTRKKPYCFEFVGNGIMEAKNGKVIGEFVCDKVEEIEYKADNVSVLAERWTFNRVAKQACLTPERLKEYLNGKRGYGWHITELKLFDKPIEITEFAFYGRCVQKCSEYDICMKYDSEDTRVECPDFVKAPLKCAPQSWCYVEEI